MKRVRQRKREIVDSFRGGSERRLEDKPNLDLIYGEARFTGSKTVQITLPSGEERELTAETIFINTGERPADPNVPGLDPAHTLNSTSIMELDAVPSHLLVIGGGYVGLEFAQMFRRFGSQVTIIQRGRQLLGREDGDVAEAVAQILAEDGIEMLLNSAPTCSHDHRKWRDAARKDAGRRARSHWVACAGGDGPRPQHRGAESRGGGRGHQ